MGRRLGLSVAAGALVLLTACLQSGAGANGTVVFIPGYQGTGASPAPAVVQGFSGPVPPVVDVALGQTDAQHMFINLSQDAAPTGKVSFLVSNTDTMTHEFVVLQTDSAAASFPIVSFEGESNRIDEEAKGVVNVGETGDMKAGSVMMLTLDLAPGHYAVVCNLPGHYAAGMHQDFWVAPAAAAPVDVALGQTDAQHMFINLSQDAAPTGKVSFLVSNTDTMTHEFVVLQTDSAAASFPIVSFEGESNRIDEEAKGVVNVGETGDMKAGSVMMLTLDLAPGHYAVVCNLPGHYAAGMHQDFWVAPAAAAPVDVALGQTDAQHMFINLSQDAAPTGKVSFLVSNTDTMTHEFVVLQTDSAAASFPIVSFEGESNRIDEEAKGVVNVGETGDMKAGSVMMLTLDLAPGHYAVVCNLPGHYAAGMHQDFWVAPAAAAPVDVALGQTDAQHMFINLSQDAAPTGKVSFLVSNTDTMTHEFVVLQTDSAAASFPIVSFEGESNRIDEEAKGVVNVGETGDMKAGSVMMLTLDLAPGHYAVVCNLPGHYAAGMHQDFWVAPAAAAPVDVALGQTDAQHMFINLSQDAAPTGKVSFLVSNTDTMTHEFVVLQTDSAAASFPIVSFEGESNRIDEEAKGVVNVGETGDMKAGSVMMLTLDLAPGHYAVVCNLPGHYAAGMHQDFWVAHDPSI